MRKESIEAMKRVMLFAGMLIIALVLVSLPAYAASSLDQSYEDTHNAGGALNWGAQLVAQTFTAGVDGTLTGLNVGVDSFYKQYPMRVAIRAMVGGVPASTELGYAVVPVGDQSSDMFDFLIPLSPGVAVSAGTEYAIVVSFDGAPIEALQGNWQGHYPGAYAGGKGCYGGPSTYQIGQWVCEDSSDYFFRTYVGPATVSVEIDIMPGDDLNCINNDGHGVIPVAILTTDDFDASRIDPFTVALDGASAQVKGKSGNAGSLEDVDSDGDLDLVVQIDDMDDTYLAGTIVATLTGLTYEGMSIEGTDSICIVP